MVLHLETSQWVVDPWSRWRAQPWWLQTQVAMQHCGCKLCLLWFLRFSSMSNCNVLHKWLLNVSNRRLSWLAFGLPWQVKGSTGPTDDINSYFCFTKVSQNTRRLSKAHLNIIYDHLLHLWLMSWNVPLGKVVSDACGHASDTTFIQSWSMVYTFI